MADRYCSSCRLYKPDAGALVKNLQGKVVRWRCHECNLKAIHRCDDIARARRQSPVYGNSSGK